MYNINSEIHWKNEIYLQECYIYIYIYREREREREIEKEREKERERDFPLLICSLLGSLSF